MATALIRLAQGLPEVLAPELERRLFFVSHAIAGYRLIVGDGGVEALELDIQGGAGSGPVPPEEVRGLEEKIRHVVETEVLTAKVLPPKVVWRSRPPAGEPSDLFPALLAAGTAFEAGEGQVAFGEPLISLLEAFDRRLRALGLGFDEAREFRYPTLLPTCVLERFGYFSSFPQFVMFVTRLHNDLDVYRAFVADYEAEGKVPQDVFGRCRDHAYCLPPTMCYHTYHQYAGRELPEDTVVTARGKSFRFESKYRLGLRRLWDFTIREIVFLGAPDFVLAARREVMEGTFALMEELGLGGTCEVATDLFFGNHDALDRSFSQRMREAKYELRLEVEADESVAVASFNFHDRLFGGAFGITRPPGGPTASGCVGFGLERLVYAFLCQHGLDPRDWPASMRPGAA